MGKNHQRKKRRRERQQSEGEGQETTSADARKEGAASLNTVETKSSLDIPSIDTTRQPDSSKKQSTSSKKRKRAKAQEKDSRDLEKDSRDLEKEHEATESQNAAKEPSFPFPTEADDHCESPLEAYKHIVPLLSSLASKDPTKFLVYDPYYCDGAVKQNMNELGFPNVYNQKEDCYKVWSDPKDYPRHDVLVTNPPYSGDHIAKLIEYITSPRFGNRPWFLLLPTWVHKRDYFVQGTSHIRPFYLVPKKRYVYVPPVGFRMAKRSETHKKSSPFVSMWYIWGGDVSRNEQLMRLYARSSNGNAAACDLARSKSALRDLRRKQR